MLNKWSTVGDVVGYYYQTHVKNAEKKYKVTTYKIIGISDISQKFVVECIYDELGIVESGELLKVDFGILSLYPYYEYNPVYYKP